MLVTFAMTIPFIGFVAYCATHFPSGQWPLWPRITIAIWFIANLLIPTLLTIKLRKGHVVNRPPSSAAVLESKLDGKIGAACYLFGILFPVIFLLVEPTKSNRFVRFHAFQAIMFWMILIPLKLARHYPWASLASVLWPIVWIMWIVLMIKAYQGKKLRLPIVGSLAERFAR